MRILFSLLFLGVAQAADLPLAGDTYVITQSPTNFGTQANLTVAPGTQTLMQFDLTGLPAGTTGSVISRANLRLYVNRVTTPGQIDVSLANGPWSEATVTGQNAPVPGRVVLSGVSLPVTGAYLTLDITAAVRAWVDGQNLNQGLLISANTLRPGSATFDSKENTITSHQAQLDVILSGTPTGPGGTQTFSSICSALNWGTDTDGCLRAISPTKLVFLTSRDFPPGMSSAVEGDSWCQDEADAVPLNGTFRAWLSDSASSPSTRFSKAGHYRLLDSARTLVATSFQELVTTGPRVPITPMVNGKSRLSPVWTGTTTSGTWSGFDCANWGSGTGPAIGTVANTWNDLVVKPCVGLLPLYCFQQ